MSTEQAVDPDLVEQTKQQIQGLVREIAQLSRSDLAAQFYSEFLQRILQALAAVGGAVWTVGDEGQLQLQYQIKLNETGLIGAPQSDLGRHSRLLHQVFTRGEGVLVPPHSGSGQEDEAGNPTGFLLVLCALRTDQTIRGVVEIFQRPDTQAKTQRGYLTFLAQMCEYAGNFLAKQALRSFSDRQTLWSQLEGFTRAAHASLDPRETAYTIANEGRRLIECDRVSVAIQKGRKSQIEAVSGQDVLDKRSNVVSLLGKLATAVVATGEPLWYTGDTTDLAPQVEEALQAYVDESHSKTVGVVPLRRPTPHDEEHATPHEPVGALIVERIEDARIREGFLERVDIVAHHSSTALANAIEYHSLFLLPVWQTLGKATWVIQARTLPKTLAVIAGILAVVLGLVLVPWDFELEGRGKLEPVSRRDVFADETGTVVAVHALQDQAVAKGDLLAEMRNTELEVELRKVAGELSTSQSQRESLHRARLETRNRDEKEDLESKIQALDATIASLEKQLAILEEKKTLLKVHSPLTGVIVSSWDELERLEQRPVKRGDVLMRVADPSQDWQLEVHMPEDRMGYIVQAQKTMGEDLSVRYVLATDPDTPRYGKIRQVHNLAEVHGEEGNTVMIRVTVDKEDLKDLLRPGADATARVQCGRCSVGFFLFHDLIAWVQSHVMFRIW